jgi:hypothetical protein
MFRSFTSPFFIMIQMAVMGSRLVRINVPITATATQTPASGATCSE